MNPFEDFVEDLVDDVRDFFEDIMPEFDFYYEHDSHTEIGFSTSSGDED